MSFEVIFRTTVGEKVEITNSNWVIHDKQNDGFFINVNEKGRLLASPLFYQRPPVASTSAWSRS
jgi:hypothetical protein